MDEDTASQWSQQNLRRWFNDGLRDLARTTRHWKSTHSVTLTASVAEYTLPSNILAIEHCYYDDGTLKTPLVARHYEQGDQIWGSHRDVNNGRPAFFTTWGYAPSMKLRLYPVPSTTNHTARLLTAILPTEMPLSGSDVSEVDIPPAWVDLLVDYAEYCALRRDRDPRHQEALQAYAGKRDQLINANDYLAINRELVPDPMAGLVPLWHVEDASEWW